MADLGQDAKSLELKVAETELLIEEKKFAKKRINLELLKHEAKKQNYEQSLKDIDKQLLDHQRDLRDLQAAFSKAQEKEVDKKE